MKVTNFYLLCFNKDMDRADLSKKLNTVPGMPIECMDRCDVMGSCAATMALYLSKRGREVSDDPLLEATIVNAVDAARGCANVKVRSRNFGTASDAVLGYITRFEPNE